MRSAHGVRGSLCKTRAYETKTFVRYPCLVLGTKACERERSIRPATWVLRARNRERRTPDAPVRSKAKQDKCDVRLRPEAQRLFRNIVRMLTIRSGMIKVAF